MAKRFTFEDLNFKADPHLASKYQTSFIRTRLSFGEKYGLSIVRLPGKNTYEIGALVDGELTELPGITAEGDTVKAGLTPDDVSGIILKMQSISASNPIEEDVSSWDTIEETKEENV